MSNTSLLKSLFKYKAWANEELFNSLQQLDENTHQAELHAAIRILNHIYVVDRLFVANLQGTPPEYTATNTTETPNFNSLLTSVRNTDLWYIEYTEKISESELNEVVNFTFVDGDFGSMSREEMLAHIVTHGNYHRGAVGRIMAQLSIAPPRDIYSRFLHASEPNRRNN
ncbi:DinB family protein [Deefgea piscis]|uniref:DinB family protein n=1 Tax=Deefgea piscis TaxID=2739061 RepID=UPI001C7EA396|nr:DinB family protein [Deefgea piscis]QZA81635.1 damage-inducible protein DinB [Deefgea piscis]